MSEKAQSHSSDKPQLGNIWRWLHDTFLLEMTECMRIPVEDMKKYPQNNWKQGRGDQEFIKMRLESAQRHLKKSILDPRSIDDEILKQNLALVAVNCMMVSYCLEGEPLSEAVDGVEDFEDYKEGKSSLYKSMMRNPIPGDVA